MRKVTFSDGTEWEVQPLTVGQVKKLRPLDDKEPIDQAVGTVEAAGFSPEQYDELPMPDFVKLYQAILAETHGTPKEVKN